MIYRVRSPALMTLVPALLRALAGKVQYGSSLSHAQVTALRTSSGASSLMMTPVGQHTYILTIRVSSTCCPRELQGLLSQELQQMRGRNSSPALMTQGPDHPPATGVKGQGEKGVSLPHSCYLTGELQGQLSCSYPLACTPAIPTMSRPAYL